MMLFAKLAYTTETEAHFVSTERVVSGGPTVVNMQPGGASVIDRVGAFKVSIPSDEYLQTQGKKLVVWHGDNIRAKMAALWQNARAADERFEELGDELDEANADLSAAEQEIARLRTQLADVQMRFKIETCGMYGAVQVHGLPPDVEVTYIRPVYLVKFGAFYLDGFWVDEVERTRSVRLCRTTHQARRYSHRTDAVRAADDLGGEVIEFHP